MNYPASNLSSEWKREKNYPPGGGECGQSPGLPTNLAEPQASSQIAKPKGDSEVSMVKTSRNQSEFADPLGQHPALISSMFPKVPPCLRFSDVNEKGAYFPLTLFLTYLFHRTTKCTHFQFS